jgi:hypothetical protein
MQNGGVIYKNRTDYIKSCTVTAGYSKKPTTEREAVLVKAMRLAGLLAKGLS